MAFDPVIREAQDPSTPPDRLTELSDEGSIAVRVEAAMNGSNPVQTLRRLSTDRSARIRRAVADNPMLPDDLLLALGADSVPTVRYAAAASARGRPAVLSALIYSPDAIVREIVAGTNSVEQLDRPNQEALARDASWEARARIAETTVYRDLFEVLLADPHPQVRGRSGGNPRASRDDLDALVTDRSAVTRRIAVAAGVRYPDDDQLVRLARDRSAEVQWAIIMRVGAPREAVEIVAKEGDELNRHQASVVLEGLGHASAIIDSVMRTRREAALLSPFV